MPDKPRRNSRCSMFAVDDNVANSVEELSVRLTAYLRCETIESQRLGSEQAFDLYVFVDL